MASNALNPFMTGLLSALQRPTADVNSERYLASILARERVDEGAFSPVHQSHRVLGPIVRAWAGTHLSYVDMSGSFAKGTANKSGTDVDLLLSLHSVCPITLKDTYFSLRDYMVAAGYRPQLQNVSIRVNVAGLKVDLVPARQQHALTSDHSIFNKRTGTWRKTNIQQHINLVRNCGHTNEIRLTKLWRDQHGLDFPSFYLELAVIRALRSSWYGSLSQKVLVVLDYLSKDFRGDRFVDPANTANTISEDLTFAEKTKIQTLATISLMSSWAGIVR